jgi:hypothetical protein
VVKPLDRPKRNTGVILEEKALKKKRRRRSTFVELKYDERHELAQRSSYGKGPLEVTIPVTIGDELRTVKE